ncbi:signal transduction histidine kinase [Xanthomonas arboricola]
MIQPRSVHWWVSAGFVVLSIVMVVALAVQGFISQRLIEHRYWSTLLVSLSVDYRARVEHGQVDALPRNGVVRAWYVNDQGADARVPSYLANLPAGLYSTESGFGVFETADAFDGMNAFHALVSELPHGRLITMIDIEELETQQNQDSIFSSLWLLVVVLMVSGMMLWLHLNLVRPVRDLAEHMQRLDPREPGTRLPTAYAREEIHIIAQASNAHLARVEQFIERERSLLDQASHEFRTPIAVIAGAVDVLKQIQLPATSKPALARIEHAVEGLSETMVALLYLAREPDQANESAEVTVLHELLPRLLDDHLHLLQGKTARLRMGTNEPLMLAAPEAMVRIAVSNLIRNAIENTQHGFVEISLQGGVISVIDSGSGFNPEEAARRYRDSLRLALPTRGEGMGLFLIGRICDRFRWRLAIECGQGGGTHAALDVRASVIPL